MSWTGNDCQLSSLFSAASDVIELSAIGMLLVCSALAVCSWKPFIISHWSDTRESANTRNIFIIIYANASSDGVVSSKAFWRCWQSLLLVIYVLNLSTLVWICTSSSTNTRHKNTKHIHIHAHTHTIFPTDNWRTPKSTLKCNTVTTTTTSKTRYTILTTLLT